MDGRAGGDYERFALHCLQTLEAAYPYSDGRFRAGLGPARAAPDYAALASAVLEFEAHCGAVSALSWLVFQKINNHNTLLC